MAKKIVETPLMKQYAEMKAKHPDAILLFRVGDFYETFSDDAIEASEILGITLTRRANGSAQYVELAGFPHHALDSYLPKLVRAGKRVAICEQLEDPKLTKKTRQAWHNRVGHSRCGAQRQRAFATRKQLPRRRPFRQIAHRPRPARHIYRRIPCHRRTCRLYRQDSHVYGAQGAVSAARRQGQGCHRVCPPVPRVRARRLVVYIHSSRRAPAQAVCHRVA